MLDKQVNIYSFDTSCFNTEAEMQQYQLLVKYRRIKNELANIRNLMRESHKAPRGYDGPPNDDEAIIQAINSKYKGIIKKLGLNKKIREAKETYIRMIKENKQVRELNPLCIKESRIISVFESSLTRQAGFKTNGLYMDMFVVEVFFYDIMTQLILNGCNYNGEHYIFRFSSAGQIRHKKIVMIKESLWKRIEPSLTCGLTEDIINQKGGVNINKYLVYIALSASSTDPVPWFDIDKSIVVDDFETTITGEPVDFIDDITYKITRTTDIPVTITHTDGCGMISPEVFDRNTMVRMPFVKGLLTKFDFKEFIRQFNGNPVIKDIYGKEHNVIEEDIQVIFTKSQFKMWKYFDSWDQYKENFKKYHCECGFCNTERDIIPKASVNYQMLQSLTDFTEDDVNYLVKKSNTTLANISKDKNTMLRVFGVTDNSEITDYYQEALSIYPELLKDEYSKAKLRSIKNSLVKQYKAGKLEIKGKYFFLIPDMFAACQYWFCGEENPQGLLANGEVYQKEFSKVKKVDLLRSPHLYREHAVRRMKNTVLTEKYFDTKGVYTSCHDLISKILMFD